MKTSGAYKINKIRFSLGTFFLLAILASFKVYSLLVFSITIATVAMILVVAIIQHILLKFGEIGEKYAPFFLFTDATLVGFMLVSSIFSGPEAGALAFKNGINYITIFFFLMYSGFLASRRITISLGIYSALIYASALILASQMGIGFVRKNTETGVITNLSIQTEFFKVAFLFLGSMVTGSIVNLLKETSADAEKAKEAAKNAELTESRKKQMESIAKKLLQSAESLQKFGEELNHQVQTQAVSIQEISSSLVELNRNIENSTSLVMDQNRKIEELNHESDSLEKILSQTSLNTENITSRVKKSSEYSKQVNDSVDKLKLSLEDVKQSFRKVEEVNSIMKEIADRTNLLALNASIESARAGEHGRGFSVVATEVSKLAESSAQNASVISKTISNSAKALQSGDISALEVAEKVIFQSTELGSINENAFSLKTQIEKQNDLNARMLVALKNLSEISLQLEDVAKGQRIRNQEVTNAMHVIDGSILQIAENTKELQAQIEALTREANELN